MTRILSCTFARGGSKGVPGKNIRMLCGRPLIAWAVQAALGSRYISRQIVSTDCESIAGTACAWGAEAPFRRPAELATDTAAERLAWRHAIQTMEQLEQTRYDVLVSIPATCPLRQSEDIDRCIELLLSTDADIVVTATEAAANPYFNMITMDSTGSARIAVQPPGNVVRRQDAPDVYELTAVAYAARRDSVMNLDSIFAGRVRAVLVPRERAVDIDTPLDFELAEFLMQRRLTSEGMPQVLRRAA
ncbi:MAG: cytidylyltransferase domain-containing protein [Planctomyces sp.]|nr:acylneuraminate cytidylyltransferase family protein [Planctomyces sp.]